MTFRTRLTLLVGAAVAASIALAAGVLYLLVEAQLSAQVDGQLDARVAEISRVSALRNFGCVDLQQPSPQASPSPTATSNSAPSTGCPIPTNLELPTPLLGGPGGYVQVIDATGAIALIPGEHIQLPVTDADRAVAARVVDSNTNEAIVEGIPVRIRTGPVGTDRAVQVALRLDGVQSILANLRLILLAVTLAGVATAAGLGHWIANATLRPVSRLMTALEHVAGTRDLHQRVDAPGNDELARLADSFNRMLDALEASERSQRKLVADASHELRTPLSSLRTNIEVLARARGLEPGDRDRLLASLVGQMERLSHLVSDLMDLASGDEPVAQTRVGVRLDELVGDCVAIARGHYPLVKFEVRSDASAVIGEPDRLRRAVGNLLDNAGKWSPEGATVAVHVRGGVVTVRDHGPGVAPEDMPHVFDRFWRASDASRTPGSGLGLAIVQQVARGHGGDVSVDNALDGGAQFRLVLPEIS